MHGDRPRRSAHVGIIVLLLALLLPAWSVLRVGATATVSNCNDNGGGSLRAAIATGGTITFTTDCPAASPIKLTGGFLEIATATTVDATGHTIVVDGNTASTVFLIDTAIVANFTNLTIQRGNATISCGGTDKCGGGIYNLGVLTLTNTVVTNNQANSGGGIFNGRGLTLTNSIISTNTATNGALTGSGGGIFDECPFGRSIQITGSTLSGNTANLGGGLYTTCSDVRIANSTLSGNHVVGATSGSVGAVYCSACLITMTGSTVSGNMADNNVGGINVIDGHLTMTNSTVSGNTAGGRAGGLEVDEFANPSNLTIIQSTITGNTAPTSSGVSIGSSHSPTFRNSIMNDVCGGTGTAASFGYNLDNSGGTCHLTGTGDRTANAMLGLLANNGGPTKTHLPQPGSAAIDQIPNTGGCNGAGVTTDQRGFVRPQPPPGGLCDIGAVEVVPSPTVSEVRPPSGGTGGNEICVLIGTGFQAGLTVTFGGAPATLIVMNTVAIRLLTPAHATPVAVDVVVTNPDGGTVKVTNGYTYIVPNPLPGPQPTAPLLLPTARPLPATQVPGPTVVATPAPLPVRRP